MSPDDDTPAAVLAALRGLGAQRVEDEAAERAAVPGSQVEQAGLAIDILEHKRSWTSDDRRTLGLPREADAGDWLATVARRLGELDHAAVVDRWLAAVEAGTGRTTLAAAAAALGRLPSLSPFARRLDQVLRAAPTQVRSLVRRALIASTVPVDAAALELMRRILADPGIPREVAADAVHVAGAFASRSPLAAALITARARADRTQSIVDALSPLPLEQRVAASRAVPSAVLADAVRASACAALAPTAQLELEDCVSSIARGQWAAALLAVAGDAGARYLARMRGRPGWSTLGRDTPEVPAEPLDALTSALADARRAALEALADAPHVEKLQAFLLGAALDRHVTRHIYRMSWRRLDPTRWLSLLAAHAVTPKRIDRSIVPGGSEFQDQLAVMRSNQLLDELLDAGAASASISAPQQLTPALRDLAVEGIETYAARLAVAPLSAGERAALERAEAELACLAD
jgi:hypothetical protein